jgi:hypothetical protein
MRIISMSLVMLCCPQKSSISCVSGRPPISEPENDRRRKISGKAATGSGFSGAPTSTRLPSCFSRLR